MACLCRCDHFFFGRIRFSHADIFTNGSLTKPCFLQNHTVIGAQTVSGNFLNILFTYTNRTGIDVIKAHQQIDECRLSTAGRSDNSNSLSRFYRQIQFFDQFLIGFVGKIYIFQIDFSGRLFKDNRIFSILCLGFFFNQFKNSSCAGNRILQFRNDAGNLIERFGILVCVT